MREIIKYLKMAWLQRKLLKSPVRKWDDTSRLYDYVMFVQDGAMHESGWMFIAIIGCWKEGEKEKFEICGYCDDLSLLADFHKYEYGSFAKVRMDCEYPSGVFRYHGMGKFKVSEALSSMDITFIPIPIVN